MSVYVCVLAAINKSSWGLNAFKLKILREAKKIFCSDPFKLSSITLVRTSAFKAQERLPDLLCGWLPQYFVWGVTLSSSF